MLHQLLEARVLLSLPVKGGAQQSEVVRHDQVPLLELVQHLQLFDLVPLGLVDAVVVAG